MMTAMYNMSRRGVATTFLTTYFDKGLDREELYYQDEKEIMDFVAGNLSRHMSLAMFGPLYEYGISAYRPEYVRQRCPQPRP
jgi:hypothetical protein